MFDSLLMAFSLYSRIPVPQAEWNDRSMRFCICFLPLVGAVIGLVQYGLFHCLEFLQTGPVLRGTFLAFLPVFLSGGIHMDGFLDTCDAIHSWKGPEERLRILKDPHVGAFAVIGGLLYCLLAAGIWSEAASAQSVSLCLVFVISRPVLGSSEALLLMLLTGIPTMTTTSLLAIEYHTDVDFASNLVFGSTLSSLLTLPMIALVSTYL